MEKFLTENHHHFNIIKQFVVLLVFFVCCEVALTAVLEVQTLIYSCFYSNGRPESSLTERLTAPYICALHKTRHNNFYTLCMHYMANL